MNFVFCDWIIPPAAAATFQYLLSLFQLFIKWKMSLKCAHIEADYIGIGHYHLCSCALLSLSSSAIAGVSSVLSMALPQRSTTIFASIITFDGNQLITHFYARPAQQFCFRTLRNKVGWRWHNINDRKLKLNNSRGILSSMKWLNEWMTKRFRIEIIKFLANSMPHFQIRVSIRRAGNDCRWFSQCDDK